MANLLRAILVNSATNWAGSWRSYCPAAAQKEAGQDRLANIHGIKLPLQGRVRQPGPHGHPNRRLIPPHEFASRRGFSAANSAQEIFEWSVGGHGNRGHESGNDCHSPKRLQNEWIPRHQPES